MPIYSVVVEVVQTRAYNVVTAASPAEAEAIVCDELSCLEYDVLEETIDTIQSQLED
jgi:hypothetical protein